MIRRIPFDKLPIQAQFYPMAGAAFVEDEATRVTLLGRQALGVASLSPGNHWWRQSKIGGGVHGQKVILG